MEFLRSGLKSVLGAPEPGAQPSGADIVERLVDRVNNSTLLEDRRDACRALKALSRNYRVEVGAQGLDTLRQVIELDRADCEIVNYTLDTLCNITSQEQFDEERDNPTIPLNIGEQFTEMFLKNPQNVKLILELLEEYDYRVRLPTVKLLRSLLDNRPKDIQEIILVSPMGVSKLMDLLSDSREVIRNDALLLLIQLTKGNANIQKIVAFENAFDRLFDVIAAEGFSEGGIVVEDCLLLMLNLLKNNTSNQNFFKEGSYIQRMLPMFSTPDIADELGWSPQKASNVHCMLQLIRTLISPLNSAAIISSSQKIMKNVHLLDMLCNTLMVSGVPADILTETINAVGEVIRGNPINQDFLCNILAPSSPPRPAIVVLLMSMVNEKQPFSLRCAVAYCFQCFLYKNDAGQTQLVQTLLPSTSEVSNLTSGQLLCGGLFSTDTLSNWFSAVSLMHGLIDNPNQKEQLLRVLLATNVGSSPVSLLHQCTVLLQQGTKLHSKVALLMLLSMWMSHCPQVVSAFLSVPGSVGYMVAQICSNEHDDNEYLLQGMCAFLMALCINFNDDSVESYTKDSLKQLLIKRIGFETFVAKLGEVSKHEMYSRAAKQPQIRAKGIGELLLDYEFCKMFKTLEGSVVGSLSVPEEKSVSPDNSSENRLVSEETPLLHQYKNLIRQQDAKLQELTAQIEQITKKNSDLEIKLEENLLVNSQLKDENTLLKAQLAANMSQPTQINDSQTTISPPSDILQSQIQSSHNVVTNNEIEAVTKGFEEKLNFLQHKIAETESILNNTNTTNSELNADLERLKNDQDDLLELLADQDTKLNQYKMKLSSLGVEVDDVNPEES